MTRTIDVIFTNSYYYVKLFVVQMFGPSFEFNPIAVQTFLFVVAIRKLRRVTVVVIANSIRDNKTETNKKNNKHQSKSTNNGEFILSEIEMSKL